MIINSSLIKKKRQIFTFINTGLCVCIMESIGYMSQETVFYSVFSSDVISPGQILNESC